MQTIDFIRTAKWIIGQFGEKNLAILFPDEDDTDSAIDEEEAEENAKKVRPKAVPRQISPSTILHTTHELAITVEKIRSNSLAVEILTRFDLSILLNPEFPVDTSFRGIRGLAGDHQYIISSLVRRNWRVFVSCIRPLEDLLIPNDVAKEQDFDEILTLELRYEIDHSPKAETIAGVLTSATELYAAIARAYQMGEFTPLTVVYADSGSSLRFDFKGLGEPIKQLKELLVELWNRYRHRKPESFEQNTTAFLSGLKVAGVIESARREGILTDEDANRYSRQIMESGIALFNSGALPREIPRVEMVSNQELLEGIQRKLLPPASSDTSESDEKEGGGAVKAKAKKPRKSSGKTKKK